MAMDIELKAAKERMDIAGYNFHSFSCEHRQRNGDWEWNVCYVYQSVPEGENIVKQLSGEEAEALMTVLGIPKKLSADIITEEGIETKEK